MLQAHISKHIYQLEVLDLVVHTVKLVHSGLYCISQVFIFRTALWAMLIDLIFIILDRKKDSNDFCSFIPFKF